MARLKARLVLWNTHSEVYEAMTGCRIPMPESVSADLEAYVNMAI